MARHKKSDTLPTTDRKKKRFDLSPSAEQQARFDQHAAYLALMARLTIFQSEISAQAKSRAANEAPAPTTAMAADLMAQIARLMGRCVEARGLPQLDPRVPATFSQTAIAFAQAHSALEAYGKHNGYDKPLADAESKARGQKLRSETIRMWNCRIVMGIQSGYLVPTGGPYDQEARELSGQFTAIVERLEMICDPDALPDLGPRSYEEFTWSKHERP